MRRAIVVLLALTLAGCGFGPPQPASKPAAAVTPTAAPATATPTATVTGTATALHVTAKTAASVKNLPAGLAPLRLTAVQFISTADGWAVGSRCVAPPAPWQNCRGVVLATHDGGGTWTASALGAGLDGIQFLDARTGWAYGESAVYATTDGGATWQPLTLPAKARTDASVAVSFVDAEHGWLIVHIQNCATQGCPVIVYATTDGGAAWREIAANVLPGRTARLPWADFTAGGDLGDGHGWLLAQTPAGIVETTADGGGKWAAKTFPTGGAPTGGAFTAAGAGWVAAASPSGRASADVWRTPDAGGAWKQVASLPGRVAALAASTDGGSAWVALQPADGGGCPTWPCGDRLAVVSVSGHVSGPRAAGGYRLLSLRALNAQTAWAVATGNGPGYAVVVTHDGGNTWRALYRTAKAPSPSSLWGFWDAQHGWALGSLTDPAAVLMTTDGGATWSQTGRAPAADVFSAGFLDAEHGWAVVDGMKAYATHDGGATWQPLGEANPCQGIQLMGFTTPNDGWLLPQAMKCDPLPQLAVTHDGGATWQTEQSDSRWFAVAFGTSRDGWAIGQRGSDVDLFATADGGVSWKPVALLGPQRWDPSKPDPLWVGAQLAAAGRGTVWLASEGRLLHSTDGGRTWIETDGPSIDRVTAAQDGTAWVQAGLRLYRVDGARWLQVAWAGGT